MIERFVCRADEFKDGERQIVRVGNQEIGIFRHEGGLFAYSNYCLHQGGPACEGLIIARVDEHLREDKSSMGVSFSRTETSFVCPWHGYEYDIRTGAHVGCPQAKLRRYDVHERDGEVYVLA